jgi:hypothetical protein
MTKRIQIVYPVITPPLPMHFTDKFKRPLLECLMCKLEASQKRKEEKK